MWTLDCVTTKNLSPVRPWAAATHGLPARRAAHTARKQVELELASYSTPADRMDLDAMLARYEPAEVADIHRIIDRHRCA